jgi:hypothetical protein
VVQPVAAAQVNPLQSVVVPAVHLPVPSQVEAEVKPELPQAAA